ncbi:Flagella basal body P ring formation protein flgA [Shigella dysenteriae 1617]|uniref:Flagella basal body P-ring formation protein FlgA n=1 Tax=Shigella dysenteriae 1617 TaxID=754093 RepID=A0A0A6ZUN4_SHIDY|nr:Flagella basal body P ring formation protein flgA [Shigella dysenteriae 1617]
MVRTLKAMTDFAAVTATAFFSSVFQLTYTYEARKPGIKEPGPDQSIQLTQFRQAWRVKAGQRVNVIASGDGFSANAEGQALNNAAVAQNARVRMVSGQVVSGVVDADGNILINL